MSPPDEIDVPVWYSNGAMMIRRDCLAEDHPEHIYNYIKNTLGVDPEEYGYFRSNRLHDSIAELRGLCNRHIDMIKKGIWRDNPQAKNQINDFLRQCDKIFAALDANDQEDWYAGL